MKITEIISGDAPSLSFEVFPPKTSDKFESVMGAAAEIAKLKPSYMSVTYGAGGGTSEYTTAICEALNGFGVTALAHLTCVSSNRGRIESELEKLRSHGIGNILALRGDIPAGFDRESAHYRHASELMKEIADFGGFCIGGACYPEGHPESANSADDIEGIQRKVDAGCEFLTTQMFFDNNILYNFLYRLYRAGIDVPVVAGVMPVTSAAQIKRLCSISSSALPQRFIRIVDRYGDDQGKSLGDRKMSALGYFYGEIPEEKLMLDANEAAARLSVSRTYTSDTVAHCEKVLRAELDCRYSGVLLEVSYPAEEVVDLGFGGIHSRDLYKNLGGCGEAFVFAVTLGYGVDRLLSRLSVISGAEYFITDALASAFAEAACDGAEAEICKGCGGRARFSPGYGDLSLEIQPQILASVDAARRLNITLAKNLMMTPSKSVTAIKGKSDPGAR